MKHVIELDFIVDAVKIVNGKEIIIWDDKTLEEHGFNLDTVVTLPDFAPCEVISFIGEKEEIVRLLKEVYCLSYDKLDEEMFEDFLKEIVEYKE